jgi:hypothetical protein
MLDYIKELLKPGADDFAEKTGCRVIPDILAHPHCQNVCTLDMPGYRQLESYTCGFVAGLMVLHTFHPEKSIKRFFNVVASDTEYGTQPHRLVKSLRACGVGVSERGDLNFAAICDMIEEGFPIITLVRTGSPDVVHWVVIYGYGTKPNRVFIAGDGLPLVGHLLGHKQALWPEFARKKWAEKGFGLVCWGK